MNFHICSSCHLLFWKARCVLKVIQGCSKTTQRKVADEHFLNGGVGLGVAERRRRRGPLLQCSTQGSRKIPSVGTSTEEFAIDRPSFCLAMVNFFLFSYLIFLIISLVVWCPNAISVSSCVSLSSCVCECGHLPEFSIPAKVTSCIACMDLWMIVLVCAHTCPKFLVSVLFSLHCWHMEEQREKNIYIYFYACICI